MKSANCDQSQRPSESPEVVQWQWQSDLDPWREKDPANWTWLDYSDEECAIIEQAFSLNQEEVNLKFFLIDLKRMLQVNKKDRHRIRRVRRQGIDKYSVEIPILREQKTINQAFGTTQHFLDFIARRTPEAYQISQKLKVLDLENQEFEEVIEQVVNCIEKASETREKIIKTRSGSRGNNFLEEGKMIVELIKKNSNAFGDFLKAILKIYTMETFICYWLNELLRSEDWEEINVLAPYLVCLVYTFQLSGYMIKYQESKGFMNNLVGLLGKQKLYLSRGAALSKEQFELYKPENVKYFSWNGITSTSKDKNVSLKFIKLSLDRARKLNESKVGVLFLIETDFASLEDCEGIIDPGENALTQFPEEQEILLAPATVFKSLKTRLIEKNIYEVSLKIVKKFEDTNENISLLGARLDQSLFKDKAIIDGLPSQQAFSLLDLLRGNKLIRMIDIKNLRLDEILIEEIEDVRRTTKVQKEEIKISDCTIIVRSLSCLAHYFSAERLTDLITQNKIQFQKQDERLSAKWKAKLVLKDEALKSFQKARQFKELWQNIKQDSQATILEVSMRHIQIESSEFKNFVESIKEMKHLESLTLALNSNIMGSTEDISHFCCMLESLSALKKLSIELALSNKRSELFKKALSYLGYLQYFHLDFQSCKRVSDEGLYHLQTALLSLKFLQHLSLDLKNCDKISDEGVNHLKIALQSLKSLQSLSLDFSNCYKISNDGLNHLKNSLISTTSLQSLILNCSWCNELSNEGLNHLQTALSSLECLGHLSLDFSRCDRISDEGLDHLQLGLSSVKSLHYLCLNFARCFKITDQGLKHLSAAISSLKFIQHSSLDFTKCDKISDEGISHICMGLKSSKSLQHLSLNFNDCSELRDEGLNRLQTGLISLSSLQHLSLNFNECSNISSEGIDHLKTALKSLILLQHLSMEFTRCGKILDEGLHSLHLGLILLKNLKHLSLNFGWCHELSDNALNNLKTALISLTSLQYLSLDFTWCDKITNEGFKSVIGSLRSLKSLKCLSINLSYCQQISDEKLRFLKYMLELLEDLRHLSLNFSGCGKITNEALSLLKDGLKPIPSFECHQSVFE